MLNLFDAREGTFLRSSSVARSHLVRNVHAVRFLCSGRSIALCSCSRRLHIVDTETGNEICTYSNCVFNGPDRTALGVVPFFLEDLDTEAMLAASSAAPSSQGQSLLRNQQRGLFVTGNRASRSSAGGSLVDSGTGMFVENNREDGSHDSIDVEQEGEDEGGGEAGLGNVNHGANLSARRSSLLEHLISRSRRNTNRMSYSGLRDEGHRYRYDEDVSDNGGDGNRRRNQNVSGVERPENPDGDEEQLFVDGNGEELGRREETSDGVVDDELAYVSAMERISMQHGSGGASGASTSGGGPYRNARPARRGPRGHFMTLRRRQGSSSNTSTVWRSHEMAAALAASSSRSGGAVHRHGSDDVTVDIDRSPTSSRRRRGRRRGDSTWGGSNYNEEEEEEDGDEDDDNDDDEYGADSDPLGRYNSQGRADDGLVVCANVNAKGLNFFDTRVSKPVRALADIHESVIRDVSALHPSWVDGYGIRNVPTVITAAEDGMSKIVSFDGRVLQQFNLLDRLYSVIPTPEVFDGSSVLSGATPRTSVTVQPSGPSSSYHASGQPGPGVTPSNPTNRTLESSSPGVGSPHIQAGPASSVDPTQFRSALCFGGKSLMILDKEQNEVLERFGENGEAPLWKLRYSSNGKKLYAACDDGIVRRYLRLPSGHVYDGEVVQHADDIEDMDISINDEFLVTASQDKSVGIVKIGDPSHGCTGYGELC